MAKPTHAEVDRMARLLAQVDADSKYALRYFLAGQTTLDFVLPIVRRRLKAVLQAPERKLRSEQRLQMLEFAAAYGVRTRPTVADEPVSATFNMRFTPTHMDLLRDAAKLSDQKLTDWCRETLVREAKKIVEDRP